MDMDIGEFRESLASSELEPKTLGVCLALTDILSKIRPGDGQHLSLSYFRERLERGARNEEILPALSILCTFKGAILEMHGYLDDEDDGQLHLEDEDFQGLLFTGNLVHPVTGDLVDDPLGHVRFFYSLRKDA